MTLTTQELNDNAMFVFMAYHVDNGGTIDNYITFQDNYGYETNDPTVDLNITYWGLSSPQPDTATLKSTYGLSDLTAYADPYRDIMKLGSPIIPVTTTAHRTLATAYANNGNLCYDGDESKLYIFISGAWIQIQTL